jgi:hypothetical protein
MTKKQIKNVTPDAGAADLVPAPATGLATVDPVAGQWARARSYVEAATLFQRASLAAQIMAGMELLELHKGYAGAGRRKFSHDVKISWEDAVKQELGISYQTAYRWMGMAKAARPRLTKGDIDLGRLLEKHPAALTPAERELLKKAVHKISDGQTQMEFLLSCGVSKDNPLPSDTPRRDIDPATGKRIYHPTKKTKEELQAARLAAAHDLAFALFKEFSEIGEKWMALSDRELTVALEFVDKFAKCARKWLATPPPSRANYDAAEMARYEDPSEAEPVASSEHHATPPPPNYSLLKSSE